MLDLLMKGRLVLPGHVVDDGWIGISGGRIACIGSGSTIPESAESVDHSGAFLLPGAIDGQTHAGSQLGFSGLGPTTAAAAFGGVTTIVDMPYDHPDPITTGHLLEQKIAAIDEFARTHVALYGTVTPNPEPSDIAALVDGGVCAFKISSFEAHPHRFPRIGSAAVLTLLDALLETDLPVGIHNEDQEIIRATETAFRAAGRTMASDHSASRPVAAEMSATATFLELAASRQARAHIVHISCPEGFAVVAEHRARGEPATAEMCLHYLLFDAETDVPRLGAKLKVNPPIRTGVRDALWRVVESGSASFVSSDHSAWSLERKSSSNIFEVMAGMPGLEALLPGFFTEALRRRKSPEGAALMTAEFLSERPARFFGLAGKGRLAPNADADIVVLMPGESVYDSTRNPEGPGWSAYHGMTFAARPIATYVDGQLAYDGTSVTEACAGRFARRGA